MAKRPRTPRPIASRSSASPKSDPVLVDVRAVGEFVPGFAPQYHSHLGAADGLGGL